MQMFIHFKPPRKWRLFLFIVLNIVHASCFLLIFKDIRFSFLLLIELFYFLYQKSKLILIIRFFYYTAIIFLLNVFFYDGQILFKAGFIKITKEGIIEGGEKSLFLLGLLFLTINVLKNNKSFFLNEIKGKNKNNLIYHSINYFFLFIENVNKKKGIKNFINNMISIYKGEKEKKPVNLKNESNELSFDFYIYHFAVFAISIILFVLKIF